MNATRHITRTFTLILIALTRVALADPAVKDAPIAPPPRSPLNEALSKLKLPGVVINTEQQCVDVEATICLTEGSLELIACTKGTKEHESIVVVEARAMHIHTALLLLGARNGNPAMRRALNEEQTRWIDLPAKGDPIGVFLVWKDADGKMIERPIGDFISRSDEPTNSFEADKKVAKDGDKFPQTFIFAGSQLGDANKKPRDYFADLSGNVISIATFGDELLCLPDTQSQENGALVWQVDSTHLPELGAKVTLRLRINKTIK